MSRDYSVPNCPWCGMASRIPPKHHHEWETVHMECGSEIYPPRSTSPSKQSEACKRIAMLTADRDRLQAELIAEANAHAETRARLATRLGCECSESDQCAMGRDLIALRAELDANRKALEGARFANRVLDSAAKDAQSWAYQLQECKAELARVRSRLQDKERNQ